MRIIGFIEKPDTVKAILLSLNLWEVPKNNRAPPKRIADSFADCCSDIDYGWEAYCQDPIYEDTVYDDEVPLAS